MSKNIKCKACNKRFTQSGSMHRHYKMVHTKQCKTFKCKLCDKIFYYKQVFQRHKIAAHSANIYDANYMKNKFQCDICGRQFSWKSSLSNHIIMVHLGTKERFECHDCGSKFKNKSNLQRHVKDIHLADRHVHKRHYNCVLCGEEHTPEIGILNHLRTMHHIEIEEEKLYFHDQDHFEQWKKNMERCTFCSYKKNYHYQTKYHTAVEYVCHRTGTYEPVANRKRRVSHRGSKKINGYCPAKIQLHIKKSDNSCEVSFVKTHIGHLLDEKELVYVRFSLEDRSKVAMKLAADVPIAQIIQDIKKECEEAAASSAADAYVDKNQLLTAKDVRNIAKSQNVRYHGRKGVRDFVNVNSYANENQEAILYHKRAHELNLEDPFLRGPDFALVAMKVYQMEKLKLYGSNVLAVDMVKQHDFLVYSLLVLDQHQEAFPCCFMVTNRHDEAALDIMISRVKDKVGVVNTNAFVGDVNETYYNAWLRVMGTQPMSRVFSSHAVKSAWNANVQKARNASPETRKKMQAELHHLLEVCDKRRFPEQLNEFVRNAEPERATFLKYFKKTFAENWSKWAFCFQEAATVNMNKSIEAFHETLNSFSLMQAEDALYILDTYVETKHEEEINDLRSVVPRRLLLLKEAHEKAVAALDRVEVHKKGNETDAWTVNSFTDKNKKYSVFKNEQTCPKEKECKTACEQCYFCNHEFRCTCKENSIREVMCKHIHLLCLKQFQEVIEITEGDELYLEESNEPVFGNVTLYPSIEVKPIECVITNFRADEVADTTTPKGDSDAPPGDSDEEEEVSFEDLTDDFLKILSKASSSDKSKVYIKNMLKKMNSIVETMESE